MLYILDWMEELKARLLSEDYGKHLMGVEDLIQVTIRRDESSNEYVCVLIQLIEGTRVATLSGGQCQPSNNLICIL